MTSAKRKNNIEWATQAARDLIASRKAFNLILQEVEHLNNTDWEDNENVLWHAMQTADKMIEIYNLLIPDNKIQLDFDEVEEIWTVAI